MKYDHELASKLHYSNSIFAALDSIEDIKNVMVHEIDGIKDQLRKWQDGKLSSIYFLNYLNKYRDEL